MFSIDVSGREPIYIQIEKSIIKFINLGIYEENSPLPSVRSLAMELGINPNTVSKAYRDLEQQGVIYTIAGKGVFVNKTELESVQRQSVDGIYLFQSISSVAYNGMSQILHMYTNLVLASRFQNQFYKREAVGTFYSTIMSNRLFSAIVRRTGIYVKFAVGKP